jgi:MerR family transcriptional regulator/heat shock protein HspR
MTRPIIPRDQVARELSVSPAVLVRYEAPGLARSVQVDQVVGYEETEVRRIWTIVSFQRDLGINLAGVELILQLRDQLSDVHHRVHVLADQLRELIDPDHSPPTTDSHA